MKRRKESEHMMTDMDQKEEGANLNSGGNPEPDKDGYTILYIDGDLLLTDSGEDMFFVVGESAYKLSDQLYEPCLYIRLPEGRWITIHHAFSMRELRRTALSDGTIKMITGDEYDMPGILMLMHKAVELARDSVDIGYLEAQCFMDYLRERGAVSKETGVSLYEAGIQNPNLMNTLLHCKKVDRTNDARYYLLKKGMSDAAGTGGSADAGSSASAGGYADTCDPAGGIANAGESTDTDSFARAGDPANDDGRFSRVISNQVRFGCGYRELPSGRQYFAWHGYPNRNDDFITYAEISRSEFEQIGREYPRAIDADRDTAERFRRKYVDGHPVIKEGWNVSI